MLFQENENTSTKKHSAPDSETKTYNIWSGLNERPCPPGQADTLTEVIDEFAGELLLPKEEFSCISYRQQYVYQCRHFSLPSNQLLSTLNSPSDAIDETMDVFFWSATYLFAPSTTRTSPFGCLFCKNLGPVLLKTMFCFPPQEGGAFEACVFATKLPRFLALELRTYCARTM